MVMQFSVSECVGVMLVPNQLRTSTSAVARVYRTRVLNWLRQLRMSPTTRSSVTLVVVGDVFLIAVLYLIADNQQSVNQSYVTVADGMRGVCGRPGTECKHRKENHFAWRGHFAKTSKATERPSVSPFRSALVLRQGRATFLRASLTDGVRMRQLTLRVT
ncbi:hypothetical protein BaRGS_00009985 [Batillaria attramentaria]|uniref:Uncharacterized protein n=1 Tax=Batillaria attramentaria TaxID=370345 RepID=A0ABD0LHJ9_9CAEN